MLHRHHPLLQAGEKNQDGGVLELFYVFPYFCILFIIAREKSHFVDFTLILFLILLAFIGHESRFVMFWNKTFYSIDINFEN